MKIKQHLHITNPDKFIRGDYDTGVFGLYGHESGVEKWIYCGEIEIDVDVDTGQAIETVTKAIDSEIESTREEFTARMAILETRKQELLALTHEIKS